MDWRNWKNFFLTRVDLLVLILCLVISYFSWKIFVSQDSTTASVLENTQLSLRTELVMAMRTMELQMKTFAVFVSDNEMALSIEKIKKFADSMNENDFDRYFTTMGVLMVNGKGETRYYVIDDMFHSVSSDSGHISTALLKNLGDRENNQFQITKDGNRLLLSMPIKDKSGFVGTIFSTIDLDLLNKMMSSVMTKDNLSWLWKINGEVVGNGGEKINGEVEKKNMIVDFGNSNWIFELTAKKQVSETINMILGAGILVSFMLYAVVFALSTANSRAEELAKKVTLDLQKYKMALDSTSNHVIITDVNGKVLYANDSVQRLTGYLKSEIIGNTPALWGKQMPISVYEEMWRTIKVEKRVYRGEIINRRKNGETYIAQATISPIISGESKSLVGFVGIEEDITERKKNEDYLSRLNDLMIGRERKMIELKNEIKKLKGGNA